MSKLTSMSAGPYIVNVDGVLMIQTYGQHIRWNREKYRFEVRACAGTVCNPRLLRWTKWNPDDWFHSVRGRAIYEVSLLRTMANLLSNSNL